MESRAKSSGFVKSVNEAKLVYLIYFEDRILFRGYEEERRINREREDIRRKSSIRVYVCVRDRSGRKYRMKIQAQTRDFSRLDRGNHRRERYAAFEVNLLTCRMRNRRQTAAPGAPRYIFHPYLYFIVPVVSPRAS